MRPEECLKYADYIMIGECEESLLDFINKLEKKERLHKINNLGFKKNNKIIINPIKNLTSNLDKYPTQDYDIKTHYVIDEGRIVKVTPKILKKIMPYRVDSNGKRIYEYYIHTTRGCPYKCTFCCNFKLRQLYKNKGTYIRKRSIKHIIDELVNITKQYDFIRLIRFTDEEFLIRSIDDLKKFSSEYKKKIGLPFKASISPLIINKEKLKILIETGLIEVSMGIQSGSESTNFKIYERYTSNKKILEAAEIINSFTKYLQIPPIYHIIVNNPFEKNKNIIETIDLILKLPKPFQIIYFPLVLYPGTKLYERGKNNGLIRNDIKDVYLKTWSSNRWVENNYATFLLYFIYNLNKKLPKQIVLIIFKILSCDLFLTTFDNKLTTRLLLLTSQSLKRIKKFT